MGFKRFMQFIGRVDRVISAFVKGSDSLGKAKRGYLPFTQFTEPFYGGRVLLYRNPVDGLNETEVVKR